MGLLGKLFGAAPSVTPDHVEDAETFRKVVLDSDLPVLLDVWSETCAPCRQLAGVLVEVATRHAGRVRVAEISTTADPAVLARLEVRATPTVIVFDQGQEVGRVVGFRPASWFDEMIAAEFSEQASAS